MAEDVMYINNYLRLYLKIKNGGLFVSSKKTSRTWGLQEVSYIRYACLHDVLCYLMGSISEDRLELLMYEVP
jgi:hypothetical protein